MRTVSYSPQIIVALDCTSATLARHLVSQLKPEVCHLKIGKQLFTAAGPALVTEFQSQGFNVFLDLKYHDIPNTVAGACSAAAELGVWMINVHALGGAAMLQAARQAICTVNQRKPLLIAVTLLTSASQSDCKALGLKGSTSEIVLRLATLAYNNGMDGVVCSAQEASMLKKRFAKNLILVTPGIRFGTDLEDDQHRVMTPSAAIAAGVDYLVVGRPVTSAKDPLQALNIITAEIEQ